MLWRSAVNCDRLLFLKLTFVVERSTPEKGILIDNGTSGWWALSLFSLTTGSLSHPCSRLLAINISRLKTNLGFTSLLDNRKSLGTFNFQALGRNATGVEVRRCWMKHQWKGVYITNDRAGRRWWIQDHLSENCTTNIQIFSKVDVYLDLHFM